MYLILLVFVAGIAITIKHWFPSNRVRSVNGKLRDVFHPMLNEGAFDNADGNQQR